jgi:hypothetical protein
MAGNTETSRKHLNMSSSPLPTKERILSDAAAWNDQPLGTRWTRRYHGIDLAGRECFYEGAFTLVPLRQNQAVLVVLQDLTDHMRLASEVDVSSRFQAVFARIGELVVGGTEIVDL